MTFHKNQFHLCKNLLNYVVYLLEGVLVYLILMLLYKYNLDIKLILLSGCLIFCSTLFLMNFLFQSQIYKVKNNHYRQLSLLRHDVKGLLSPALLQADRIILNKSADKKIIQSAESIASSIEKTSDYLNATKKIDNLF